ncbi:MAG: methyltransferase family protein [Candidatus Thorarchaeota archaeon]
MVKGIEKIREKLPGYPGIKIVKLVVLAPIMTTVGLVGQLFIDITPRLFPGIPILAQIEPILPIFGSIAVAAIGLTLLTSLWRKKGFMQELHGDLAYQSILPRGIAGVYLMVSIVLHAFFSIRSLPPGPPVNELTITFSKSALNHLGIPTEIDLAIRITISIILGILGLLAMARALHVLGLDHGLLVYVYFPEEAEFKEHAIYSVIRHPIYFGALLIGAAAFIFRLSLYSFLFFGLVYICLRIHIYVEEGELLERFGDGYKEYMLKVPGLHIKPSDFGAYIRFLSGRE